jgi:hypothetical protein
MPLANIIGIDNHIKTFTVALSFIRAEAATDFQFIFKCLDEQVFYDIVQKPRVLISDQSAGMMKALCQTDSWNEIIHQLCGGHMVQNIKAFIQRHRNYQIADELHKTWTAIWNLVELLLAHLDSREPELFSLLNDEEKQHYRNNRE